MMRKTCAISFAAFYLLLSTGVYVCMLHCAGEYFFKPQEENNSHKEAKSSAHEKEPCSKDKDCKCCNEHGQYVINENIKTADSTLFSALAVLNIRLNNKELFISRKEANLTNWPKGKAPPGSNKIPLYISNRNLLI